MEQMKRADQDSGPTGNLQPSVPSIGVWIESFKKEGLKRLRLVGGLEVSLPRNTGAQPSFPKLDPVKHQLGYVMPRHLLPGQERALR
jgi:hypothetical protein